MPRPYETAFRPVALAAIALVGGLLATPLAADYTVRLRSQVLNTDDLDRLESAVPEQHFIHSYRIPYDDLEPQIEQALATLIDQTIQSELGGYHQTYDCSYPCDWVSWQILDPSLSFQFTDQGQPQITSQDGGTAVEVRLATAARVRYTGKIRGKINTDFTSPATPGGTDEEDFPFDIRIDATADGLLRLGLYPTLAVQSFEVVFGEDAKVSINGVEEYLTAKGAELGSKVGFTPGGIVTGGPLAWGVTGAIFGNEGGEILEEWVGEIGETYVSAGVQQGFGEISQQLEEAVGAADLQAQNIQQQLLQTAVPGTGKTVAQWQAALGLSLDVRAETPGTDLTVTVTARLNPPQAGEGFAGRLVIPKKECIQGYHGTVGAIPGPTVEVNEGLADHVGQPCHQVLAGTERVALRSRAFLGHQPPGTSLPYWKGFGSVKLVGELQDHGDYYQCGFRVGSLPSASVIEIQGLPVLHEWVPQQNLRARYLVAGGLLLDHSFDRVRSAHLGGAAGCAPAGAGGSGLELGGPAAVAEEIENCPQCGPTERQPGAAQSNPATTQRNPAAVQRNPGAASTGPGVTHPGARQGFQPQPDPPRGGQSQSQGQSQSPRQGQGQGAS